MITATTPPVPLTVPLITLVAKAAIKPTLRDYPGATFKVSSCHKTIPHYGSCNFYVLVHRVNGHLQKCSGRVDVRNIGHGFEHRFAVSGCKDV